MVQETGTAAKTARVSLSIGLAGVDPSGGDVSQAGGGVVDFTNGTAEVTLHAKGHPALVMTIELYDFGVAVDVNAPS